MKKSHMKKTKRPSKRIPRKQLQVVYDLAQEMSMCSSYFGIDENGDSLGRRQDILDALNKVRVRFGLTGKEQP